MELCKEWNALKAAGRKESSRTSIVLGEWGSSLSSSWDLGLSFELSSIRLIISGESSSDLSVSGCKDKITSKMPMSSLSKCLSTRVCSVDSLVVSASVRASAGKQADEKFSSFESMSAADVLHSQICTM